jgi:restriction endonuclease S subunit
MNTINDIAEISFGYYTKSNPTGTIPYLQISDFDSFGKLQTNSISTFVDEDDASIRKQLLRKGDVLMPARGIKNNAYVFREEFRAVASTLFFIIRINDTEKMLSEFLCIYLNHPKTQAKIKAMVSSSVTVPTINKKDFLALPVPIVSIQKQKNIIQLHQLQEEERETITLLLEKKEQLTSAIITKILEKS